MPFFDFGVINMSRKKSAGFIITGIVIYFAAKYIGKAVQIVSLFSISSSLIFVILLCIAAVFMQRWSGKIMSFPLVMLLAGAVDVISGAFSSGDVVTEAAAIADRFIGSEFVNWDIVSAYGSKGFAFVMTIYNAFQVVVRFVLVIIASAAAKLVREKVLAKKKN